MKLKTIYDLLMQASEGGLTSHEERDRFAAAAEAIATGDIEIPWRSESGDFRTDVPLSEWPEIGTPLVPSDHEEEDEECSLDFPIASALSLPLGGE